MLKQEEQHVHALTCKFLREGDLVGVCECSAAPNVISIETPQHNNEPPPSGLQMSDTHKDCFNIQWLLFIFGWVLLIPSIVAAFLPLCNGRKEKFPTKSYLAGWIANLVLLVIEIIVIIAVSATVSSTSCCDCNNNYCYGASYCC
jgi:hypothetical protein